MYPVIRMAKELWKFRSAPPLALGEAHVSHHVCWPQDIDVWMELNNGRTLTLYDLGRVVLFQRMGFPRVMRERRWAGTILGGSTRYRKRVRMGDRIEMRSRIVGWDARFSYAEQSMRVKGVTTSHALLRMGVTSKEGLVPSVEVEQALGLGPSPALPEWISAWAEADGARPWPPMEGAATPEA
ncbi:acyl-CoA thioesterase FadM [Hasllibacter halocynthiae]|uniref:Acyl-CoA thioesterase FadM n=1 Tax=Hasllibacter halocynthiae TaxID=595589 RepID=A0A2T0X1N4_9RHOB|nr:acyl-CoA thioesterase [Hasllibacter halocynthiae]PRY92827.1 acyl-CoA thioesterase FadM [Hasllibacter halocynthiae]